MSPSGAPKGPEVTIMHAAKNKIMDVLRLGRCSPRILLASPRLSDGDY